MQLMRAQLLIFAILINFKSINVKRKKDSSRNNNKTRVIPEIIINKPSLQIQRSLRLVLNKKQQNSVLCYVTVALDHCRL